MIPPTVNLAVAQKLAEVGCKMPTILSWVDLGWSGDPSLRLSSEYRGIYAPTHLQALEWLAMAKGWEYNKTAAGWSASTEEPFKLLHAPDPDSILLAILIHMEEQDAND